MSGVPQSLALQRKLAAADLRGLNSAICCRDEEPYLRLYSVTSQQTMALTVSALTECVFLEQLAFGAVIKAIMAHRNNGPSPGKVVLFLT